MPHPRFWRPWIKFLALASVPVTVILVRFVAQLLQDRPFAQAVISSAPLAAVTVALMSFVATAAGLVANWQRQRREATIKAWGDWSNGSAQDRRVLTRAFGAEALTPECGRALVDKINLTDEDREGAQALTSVLNGLERISAGVLLGVYDLRTLSMLGGTIMVRQYERAEAYVDARRRSTDHVKRQAKSFESLERVCQLLKRGQLLDEKRKIDQQRLADLRQRRR